MLVLTGAPESILSDHEGELISVEFNSTGELLLTGSFDHTARIWDIRTGQCVHVLRGHDGEVRLHKRAQYSVQTEAVIMIMSLHVLSCIYLKAVHNWTILLSVLDRTSSGRRLI